MDLNSNLLNEVIADAKAVKETAIQAAIGTLKETFEPTVRRMISQKLAEEGELEDDEPMEEPVTEEEYVDDGADGTPADNLDESDDMEDTDPDLEEVLRELEGDFEEEEDDMPMDEPAPEPEMDDEDEELTAEDIDAMIAEMEAEEDEPMEESADEEAMEEVKSLRKENAQLKSHLKEAYKAITTQKNTINEVNMMNSKLLFLTKIINKHNIKPEQQVKILEAFDRCATVREVQLTYATLAEALEANRVKKTKKIVESASKPVKTARPQRLNEQFSFSKRWQELAGITG